MQNRGLIGLFVVTLAAVALAVFVARGGPGAHTDPLVGTHVLPQVTTGVDGAARVALVTGGVKTTLVRQGNDWTVEERGFYRANADKVGKMLLGLADLTYVEPKTKKPDLYSRLELEDADKPGAKSTLVTVSDPKGSLLGEIITGKHRVDQLGGGNDGIYVRKPGDAQSWLARGALDLSGTTADWLDKPLLDLPAAQVKSVALTPAGGTELSFRRQKPGDKFALSAPPPAGKKLKSDSALDEPAGALAGLDLADVRPAKDFDFPPQGASAARFETFDGLVVTVTLADKEGAHWAKIAATGTGEAQSRAAELTAKFQPWVFGLADYKAKALETKLDDVLETPKGS
ncbi:MAG TPA: DUF4340 domain-containing protein [Stellaceae bacterium]|nr:DUF4340 domain-containing protein [Stellaceae bacterium]